MPTMATNMSKKNALENGLRKLTLYRDDSTTQVVFENVKHFFFTAGNTILTIAQFTDLKTGAHKYIHWPRERFCWFKDEKQG